MELGDETTVSEASDSHIIARAFPHTLGQPLAHFLRETAKVSDAHIITQLPSIRVGIVFCGRQAPGGHNVIWGLYQALKVHNAKSTLLGFLGKVLLSLYYSSLCERRSCFVIIIFFSFFDSSENVHRWFRRSICAKDSGDHR